MLYKSQWEDFSCISFTAWRYMTGHETRGTEFLVEDFKEVAKGYRRNMTLYSVMCPYLHYFDDTTLDV